ncbi:MAG: LLM class flavin-dependent oxidoreductase [Actinomycetota bacterium]|nr:LLM class flavin-dependent oxidoreductase [Actinomycetota bacterium]
MSRSRPTLGVHLMPTAPVGQLVELAVFAEQRGATRCWINDEGLNTRDPYVTLSAIAGATHAMALGPGIANPFSRHPGATVAAIASLDEWSGGRAFLGLGAGGGMALGPDRKPAAAGLIPTLEESIDNKVWLVGTADDVAEQIAEYRDALGGLQDLMLFPAMPGDAYSKVDEQLHRIAEGVLPQL